jgi:ABC-type multidrug transport system fused ATPase/permease subunit
MAIVVVAVAARIVPLEMQKRIVNDAIMEHRSDRLIFYCGVYLVSFLTAGGLKYLINALQTLIGQRTLARMRNALFSHLIRLPYGFFRRIQSGAVVTSVTTELASAGDFIGASVAVPFINILTLIGFAGYLFWLNPLLAAVSFSVYPVVMGIIPILQKRVNHYNRQRIAAAREVSGKIGEVVDGLHEVKTADAYHYEETLFRQLVDRLSRIRVTWNLYRFGIKTTNNLFVHFSRFLMFSIGGYLALKGRLDIGAMVAFLSAQERLYTPWKELIRFYQAYQTAAVTYRRTMDTYDLPPEAVARGAAPSTGSRGGSLDLTGVGYRTPAGNDLLTDISVSLSTGEHLALVGASGSGKSTLAHCLVRLIPHSRGSIRIGDGDIADMSRADLAATFGFVSQQPFVFDGTIDDNLVYGLIRKTGAGSTDPSSDISLDDRIEAIQQAGLFIDVLGFGMNTVLPENAGQGVRKRIVTVRNRLAAEEDAGSDAIVRYDPKRLHPHIRLGENLMFGNPIGKGFEIGRLSKNRHVTSLLEKQKLISPLEILGFTLLGHIGSALHDPEGMDHVRHRLEIDPKKMTHLRDLSSRLDRKKDIESLSARDRMHLLQLALSFTPSDFPGITVGDTLTEKIIESRHRIRQKLTRAGASGVSFFDKERYTEGADLLDNILFGRLVTDRRDVRETLYEKIYRLSIEENVFECIVSAGLGYRVGNRGENLSGGQQQKLAIARMFLKKPPILVMDEATASLDRQSQAKIQQILETRWKGRHTLVAVMHRLDAVDGFDRIAVMKGGRIEETGTYDALMDNQGLFHGMVHGGNDAPPGPLSPGAD